MTHRLPLSNGQVMLIEEDRNSLHIALEEKGFPGVVDYYICEINANGVLVMPNSGEATLWLTQGLKNEQKVQKQG